MQVTVVISRGHDEGEHWDLESTLAGLCAATPGMRALIIPHLYHLAHRSPLWERLAEIAGPVVCAAWLHPRPAEWLLRSHQVGGDGLKVLNLADFEGPEGAFEAILQALDGGGGEDGEAGGLSELAEPVRARWYPVIDASRCENCQHCLQFCLFGVYELVEGRVTATRPDACKAGCPACSRICPAGAIMFPLYVKDEAIAGAPGRMMAPDAAARKMFYLRTRRTCPVCGSTPEAAGRGEESICEECGRALEGMGLSEQEKSEATPAMKPEPVAEFLKDDLDALLDDLDSLARG